MDNYRTVKGLMWGIVLLLSLCFANRASASTCTEPERATSCGFAVGKGFDLTETAGIIVPEADTFVFSFRPGSDVLVDVDADNQSQLDAFNVLLRINIDKLRAGNAYLAITSYMRSDEANDPRAINNASVQGSVVRAYVKIWYRLDHDHFTFAIDTAHRIDNKVRVEYIESPIPSGMNRAIEYTLSKSQADIVEAVGRYRPVPFSINGRIMTAENLREYDAQEKSVISKTPPDDGLPAVKGYPDVSKSAPAQKDEMTTVASPLPIDAKERRNLHPRIGIKTNLLYWAGVTPELKYGQPTPNLEIEFYAMQRWSISIDGSYAAWNLGGDSREYWGINSLGIEPRFWFRRNNLFRGFYIGLYGQFGQFDIKQDKSSPYGHTGDYAGGGLSVGFVQPLAYRLFFEVGLRGGFVHSTFETYSSEPGHYYYEDSGMKNKFGFGGARISFMYRFGQNGNRK